ncbi:MAG: response regulator [bacterium]|nr:response regulator [bacterium]
MAHKILFIEDDPGLQKALCESLKDAGYEVLCALDGEEGLRLAQRDIPDVVLLDLILPKKDGFEVLKEIRGDSRTASIPVIVLTNLEGSSEVQKALERGATAYLVKTNYELSEVIEKIGEVLKK